MKHLQKFNASIVLYNPELEELEQCLKTFKKIPQLNKLYIINNNPDNDVQNLISPNPKFIYLLNSTNLGYGRAHNIALKKTISSSIKYHLILNTDIYFNRLNLDQILIYLDKNEDVGLLIPKVLNLDGTIQSSIKLLPSPLDLILRRFLPKKLMLKRRKRYQLDKYDYSRELNAPFISGCFMMTRTEALKEIGIFDDRYFMYCEDLDLSRRIHEKYKTILHPDFCITHRHEKGSSKSAKMLYYHIESAIKYFNKFGWFNDPIRKKFNKEVISRIS